MRSYTAALVLLLLLGACGSGGVPSTTGTEPNQTSAPSSAAAVFEPSEGVTRSSPNPDAPVGDLVAGMNDAGFDLWRQQPIEDDFVFSPLSIGHALLMAHAAADGATVAAIDETFAFPEGESAHQAWNGLDRALADSADGEDGLVVTIADKIWPRLDVEPEQEWIDLLVAHHDVTTEGLDYAGDTEGARERINEWVADQTEDLIPELLPAGFIRGNTVLVLTDAVYFEAGWQRPFGKYSAVEGEFTHLDGSTSTQSYMRELELADRRGSGDGFVGAEVPYVGGEYSMLVIVPEEGRFEEIRDGIDSETLDEIDASFTEGPFELLLPKWETTTELDLMSWLTELGAAPGAYPAIAPDAFLGAAVHGADIAVDEKGTVAAAATALGFNESAGPEPELTVAADKPFLYLIRHRPSGAVVFAGQVTDPTG